MLPRTLHLRQEPTTPARTPDASRARFHGRWRHPLGQRPPRHCFGLALFRPQDDDAGIRPSGRHPAKNCTVLYQGSSQDRYHSPGEPVEISIGGKRVLALTPDGSAIYFFSPGASRTGDKPFVATMPVTGGDEKILWRSADPYYADPARPARRRPKSSSAASRKPSRPTTSPPRSPARPAPTQVTQFSSPYKDIALPSKQVLHYKRADGLDLTATLWLPAGYDKSEGPAAHA